MEAKTIIVISGAKRSGKDYSASLIKKELESIGKSVEIIHFADPLKQIIATSFDISLEKLDELKNESDRIKLNTALYGEYTLDTLTDFRILLQRFGSEAMKPVFGDDVWGDLARKSIDKSDSDYIIIPDFRFIKELDSLNGLSIISIYVQGKESFDDSHSSEVKPKMSFDHEIDNTLQNDSPEKFAKQLVKELL